MTKSGMSELVLSPIGHVESPFATRAEAPRQPRAAEDAVGEVVLLPGRGFEDALEDIEGFAYLWLIFGFHLNEGFRPKVMPPRSEKKRGVFATRSPYRPNPLGLSAVRLLGVSGLRLRVAELDILDGTPVYDIKPYIAWADAIPEAGDGWLGARPEDPGPRYAVDFSRLAELGLTLFDEQSATLREEITRRLSIGPTPHAYRRIKKTSEGYRMGLSELRVDFVIEGSVVTVRALRSGYRKKELRRRPEELARHLELEALFDQFEGGNPEGPSI